MSEQDTREKLEADVREWHYSSPFATKPSINMLFGWLDRQAAITKTEIAENYNLQPDTSSQTVRNADSYDLDTREKLEADIRKRTECSWVTAPHEKVIDWLDRQAAITRAEVFKDGEFDCMTCDAKRELQERVDSLTAELESYRKVPEQGKRDEPRRTESEDSREKLEADVYKAAEELDNLYNGERFINTRKIIGWLDRQAAITAEETSGAWEEYRDATQREIAELTAERDELKEQLRIEHDQLKGRLENQAAYIAGVEDSLCRCESQLVRDAKIIDELTAEVEKQRQRANDAERGALSNEWYVARDRYEDDVAALTAERDYWRDEVQYCMDSAYPKSHAPERGYDQNVMAYPDRKGCTTPSTLVSAVIDQLRDAAQAGFYASKFGDVVRLTAERDQLSRDLTAEHALLLQFEEDNERMRETIDAMGCGQFYAMYRQACKERDELKREHERERQQMQRVINTQRESFKKMEFELAQAVKHD